MKNHYLRLIEKELDRLWVGRNNVIVLPLGKDKFYLTSDKRQLRAKGHEVARILKKLPNKAGPEKFWKSLEKLSK